MTARRLPRLVSAICGVLLAALLSGCVDVKFESEFNTDGSALHAFEATIEREGIEQLESMGGEMTTTFDPEDGREQAEAAGFDFTPIETDDEVGSRVSKTYEDGEDVGAAFDEMLSSASDAGTALPAGAVDGTFVKDGDEYRLNLTIDSDLLFSNTGATGAETEDLGFGDLDSFFDITYTATMPGEIAETNGRDLGDGKVEWDLPLTGITEITAVSEEGGGSGSGLIILAGLVGLLAIGALVGGYLFTRRPSLAPAASSAATFNAPPTTAPAGSLGANPPPLDSNEAPVERPSSEKDTTRLTPETGSE